MIADDISISLNFIGYFFEAGTGKELFEEVVECKKVLFIFDLIVKLDHIVIGLFGYDEEGDVVVDGQFHETGDVRSYVVEDEHYVVTSCEVGLLVAVHSQILQFSVLVFFD